MLTIHKFPVPAADEFDIMMPHGAQILSLQVQRDQPCIWALVDTTEVLEVRRFKMFGTGHTITSAKDLKFIGTFQVNGGSLVFHVFEVV
jgi:hypothetical protein